MNYFNSEFDQGFEGGSWQDYGSAYGDLASQAYDFDAFMPSFDSSFSGWGTEDFPVLTIDDSSSWPMMDSDPQIGAQWLADNYGTGEDLSGPSDLSGGMTEYPLDVQIPQTASYDSSFSSPQFTETGIVRQAQGDTQTESALSAEQYEISQEFYSQVADKFVDLANDPNYSNKDLSAALNELYSNPSLDATKLDQALDFSLRAADIAKDIAGSADPNQTWADHVSDLQSLGLDPMEYVSKVNQDLRNTQTEDGSYSDRMVSLNSDGGSRTFVDSNPLNETIASNAQDSNFGFEGDIATQDPDSAWADHADDGIFLLPADTNSFEFQPHTDDGIGIDPHSAFPFETDSLTADVNFGDYFQGGDWSDFYPSFDSNATFDGSLADSWFLGDDVYG